jgi:hypothetical protein
MELLVGTSQTTTTGTPKRRRVFRVAIISTLTVSIFVVAWLILNHEGSHEKSKTQIKLITIRKSLFERAKGMLERSKPVIEGTAEEPTILAQLGRAVQTLDKAMIAAERILELGPDTDSILSRFETAELHTMSERQRALLGDAWALELFGELNKYVSSSASERRRIDEHDEREYLKSLGH